jgi:flagella basal body P-ring formation protein FlgA
MDLFATENRHESPRRLQGRALLIAAFVLVGWISAAAGQPAGAGAGGAVGTGAGAGVEPTDSIRALAESFVRSQLPPDANVADVIAGTLDSRLRLVRCTGGMHAQLPPGAALQARAMVAVACKGPVHWTVYVQVTVESRITVLVLKHPVARDARLTKEDVTVETRKVTGLTTAFLTDVKDLESRSAERPLPMGTTLTADMLKPDLVIHHGQDVTLVAAAGGIEVRAAGRALADAAAGTRLKVQNLSSMKVVEGVAEGPDVVRISP